RTKYASMSEEKYLEALEKELNDIEISEYTIENKTDLNNPIVETFSFLSNKHCERIGDKLYLNPLMFYALTTNPFNQEKRDYPVDFVYPNQEKYNVFINLPEGYVVETLPAPINLAFSGNEMFFKYSIINSDNKLQLVVSFDTNQAILAPDSYEELKAFYNEMIKKQTEKIVLKKA
ncbi:MAG: hypothetical protein QM535_17980, partial [Limnohabitans sp.]|nr:hypothetical protein [Limnohabitans sp.]